MKKSYYPLFLNLDAKKCVIFGGGEVALRKVKMLLDFRTDVAVISPEVCPELVELGKNRTIKIIARKYHPDDLNDALIAIAATDDEKTNQVIAHEAGRKGVLVNVVDRPELCDFIVPAYIKRGDVTIAVSTNGKSPALARKIRARLEQDFGEEYAALAELIGEVRGELRKLNARLDGENWQEALDLDLLTELLRKGETGKARAILLDSLKTAGEVSS